MQFSSILSVLALGLGVSATSVSYDTGYDDASRSLTTITCSDGANGLITRYGWQTQGQVSHFPFIGGSDQIAQWNSPNCGKCYSLTYQGHTIYMLAVDHAASGFNVAQGAMDALTNGQSVELGRVEADTAEVDLSFCGLKTA